MFEMLLFLDFAISFLVNLMFRLFSKIVSIVILMVSSWGIFVTKVVTSKDIRNSCI